MIATWSYSQNTYPSKIVIDQDTIVCITPTQLSRVNQLLYDRIQLKNQLKQTQLALTKLKLSSSSLISINEKLNSKNTELFVEYTKQLKMNEINDKLIEYYINEIKVKQRQKTRTFFGGLAIGAIASTTTILILQAKK